MHNLPFLIGREQPAGNLLLVANDDGQSLYLVELLKFFCAGRNILHFPSWETLPYDQYSAPRELVSQRLQVLSQLPSAEDALIVIAAPSLRQRLCPQSHLDRQGLWLHLGQRLPPDAYRQRLARAGYREVRSLKNPGDMLVFPQQLDLYPFAGGLPVSVRWQGERVSELRRLDLKTNETKVLAKEINLLPAAELDLSQPLLPPGQNPDYFLPRFFSETACFLDYLPSATRLRTVDNLPALLDQHREFCRGRWREGLPAEEEVWFEPATILDRLRALKPLELRGEVLDLPFSGTGGERQRQWEDYRRQFAETFIYSSSPLDSDAIFSPLRHSFSCGDQAHLFKGDLEAGGPERSKATTLIGDLAHLQLGAPVIHSDFGVGRYEGLEEIDGEEMLKLRYQDGAICLAVSQLNLLVKYSGPEESAPLHSLSGKEWQKLRARVKKSVDDVAAQLLERQAQRERAAGLPLRIEREQLQLFNSAFPYKLTPDQASAIEAVTKDLAADRPMDRLICGDVGFGKTEVALRASFIAVKAGYQVALLAPTTLLAEQHEQKFRERFRNFARLGALSRFKSAKEQKEILRQLAAGELDLIIGTHRLLQKDVAFKNLGLLIIDEEQRFGVRAKEKLKELRQNVNLLTLSATPIPRTLSMALNGLRDLSIINTAPRGRQNIITRRMTWDEELIREGCQRELARGGQIYFLHNDVATMERMERLLQEIVPGLRIAVAHGQMHERELERVMLDFAAGRYDLLLSSTIIESGIDIANANSIFINRADRFGLGQLHQLRGRVGRGSQQAYAYLISPADSQLSSDGQKRLDAFCQLNSLGAGFLLASQDLEIRGGGEVLGLNQSGKGTELGLGYYLELLESTVEQMKNERLGRAAPSPVTIDLAINASLPAELIRNPQRRLAYYQQLAQAKERREIDAVLRDIEENYGPLRDDELELFQLHELRLLAEAVGIREIRQQKQQLSLTVGAEPQLNREKLLRLLAGQPERYQLRDGNRIVIGLAAENVLRLVKDFLNEIKEQP